MRHFYILYDTAVRTHCVMMVLAAYGELVVRVAMLQVCARNEVCGNECIKRTVQGYVIRRSRSESFLKVWDAGWRAETRKRIHQVDTPRRGTKAGIPEQGSVVVVLGHDSKRNNIAFINTTPAA